MLENKPERGLLLVVSGPSGVGKGTICQSLIANNPNLHYSISATTRSPRQGEVDGVNYFFISKQNFLDMISNDAFLEWAEVFGNYYGTPKSSVEEMLVAGKDVILEIDVQGAMKVKSSCPEGVFIFILPPTPDDLRKRIIGRGTESEESIACRVAQSQQEMAMAEHYHFSIINDDLEAAVAEFADIIKQEKTKRLTKNSTL